MKRYSIFLSRIIAFVLFLFPASFMIVPATASEICDPFSLSIISHTAFVVNHGLQIEMVCFSDGSKEVITTTKSLNAYNQVTANRTSTLYTADNKIIAKVTLTGTFSYNGIASICTNARANVTIYLSGWSIVSEDTGHSGNTASTEVELAMKILGITVQSKIVNSTITCDKDGNIT